MSKLQKIFLSVAVIGILWIVIGRFCDDYAVKIVSMAGIALSVSVFGGFLRKFMDAYALPWTQKDIGNALVQTVRVIYCAGVALVVWWVSDQLAIAPPAACFFGILAGHWIWNPDYEESGVNDGLRNFPDATEPSVVTYANLTQHDDSAGR